MLVAGCASASPMVLPVAPTQTPNSIIPIATLTPKSVDTQTPTKVIPTSTDLPIRSCENEGFPIESASDLNASGEVLLLSTDVHRLAALNLETRVVSTIYYDEDNELSVFGSSPDQNWLVYAIQTHDSNGDMNNEFTLELLSQTGERIQHQMNVSQFEPLFTGDVFVGFGRSTWINNDLIYTSLLKQNPSKYASKTVGSIPVVLNPFTGSWEEDILLSPAGLYRETV
jgi:hypothetical protein